MKTVVLIEGIEVTVEISGHAQMRMAERGIDKYVIFSFVLKMGERILTMKNGTEFAIIDKEEGIGVVYTLNALDEDIFIDVKTVIENDNIWISRGTRVLNVRDVL